MPTALLLGNIDPVAVDLLSSSGYEIESLKGALDETDLAAVGAFCISTKQIDLGAAAAGGVAVFNAPLSNTAASSN